MRFFMRFLSAVPLIATFALSACSKNEGTSSVSFRIPSVTELEARGVPQSKSVTALGIPDATRNWAYACFLVNVTGPEIASVSAAQCDISLGKFAGSVPPSTSVSDSKLSLQVPKGSGRKFEIFAYFRNSTSEACPSNISRLSQMNLDHTARIGSTTVDLAKDEETVDIVIQVPGASDSVITQYSLPATCVATGGAIAPSFLRATAGSLVQQTTILNGYKATVRLGVPGAPVVVSPGGYKLIRRGAQ